MPFDAGLTAAVVKELNNVLSGAKIEKIQQPERDEIVILSKNAKNTYRLLLCAKAGSARLGLTNIEKENPSSPPMFCMLLRKHLSGGIIKSITQLGFERAVRIEIGAYNELGFQTNKYLILETTGRYSNIVFCNEDNKVVSALRLSEGLSDEKRPLLCGFSYEALPVPDGKENPLTVTKKEFVTKIEEFSAACSGEYPCDKYLVSAYIGLSPLIAREIVFRTAKHPAAYIGEVDANNLFINFEAIYRNVSKGNFVPTILLDSQGKVLEYSFCEIFQYGSSAVSKKLDSFSLLLDEYYGKKDLADRIRQKSQDILKLLTNASARINKKAELQRRDLADCKEKDKYRSYGDLITSSIYLLKKGMTTVKVIDYSKEDMPEVEISLEVNLTPSQNAQKYYKKYNKLKSAEENLKIQLESAMQELAYIDTVFESLTKAQTEKDIAEIREELSASGYGKKLESLSRAGHGKKQTRQKQSKTYSPMTFVTSGGWQVLCGKNNLQNDYITTVKAGKNDYWFHVKNMPGSHTVMLCGDAEPDALDFTECAMIAAYYSSGRKIPNVAVDYTKIRNIKKPSGAKPGFVIYETNYSAYVTADEKRVLEMRTDEK